MPTQAYALFNTPIGIDANNPMIEIVTRSSINVKPEGWE